MWTSQDFSLKTLLNKRVTDSVNKGVNNEKGDFTINIHSQEIWLDSIPGTPPVSTTSVIHVYSSYLTLIEDQSVPGQQAWFASSNSITSSAQTDEASRLKNWISDKYNGSTVPSTEGYGILLYDNSNTLIPSSDSSNWIFNCQTGILTFQNANTDNGSVTSRSPFKITGYRYIGRIGAGSVVSVGGQNGIITDQPSNGPITASGNLSLDLTYSPTWTGTHTFTNQITLPSASPTVSTQAASKGYVDTQITTVGDGRYLQLSGGTLTGNLQFSVGSGNYGIKLANITAINRPSATGTNTGALLWDLTTGAPLISDGTNWNQLATMTIGSTNITGSGTINTLPIFSPSGTQLSDSLVSQSGTTVTVNGHIKASTKSFDIPHPTIPGSRLVHGSLEGPEHGAYYRGHIKTTGTNCEILLPDYWEKLIGEDYTVNITPYGPDLIYVAEKSAISFKIERSIESNKRNFGLEFDFLIIGSRKDAPLKIVQ